MTRQFFSIRGISIALAFVAATTLLWIATSAKSNSAKDTVWDDKASSELAAALHHTHELANNGDLKALKQLMLGDEKLVTFELNADQMTPIPLRSKAEIDKHIDAVNAGITADGNLSLDMPKMNCRATATFGVCTEECTIRLTKADGTQRVDHFFGTGSAIKTNGEWKWVQWHMSVGGQREIVKNGKVETVPAGHGH
jgi:hypothetical protein